MRVREGSTSRAPNRAYQGCRRFFAIAPLPCAAAAAAPFPKGAQVSPAKRLLIEWHANAECVDMNQDEER